MNIFEAVLILLLLVAVSAFVSCSELALASSRKIKLQVLGKEGDTRALDVLNMQEQPGSFITVVQIGLNAVAILAGIVGEAAVRPYLARCCSIWAMRPGRARSLLYCRFFWSPASLFCLPT